jgi:uncharacterized iron-regulated membrane protein
LPPRALFERVGQAQPGVRLLGLTLQSDSREAAVFQVEGESGPGNSPTLYVNPYTGEVQGEGSTRARTFFRKVTDWHRWLAVSGEGRGTARSITGTCNVAFFALALSGIYLWWPRRWAAQSVQAVTVFSFRLNGRARDWNWHNVTGIWCSLILIVLTGTAVVLSYPGASDLVYSVTGSALPPRPSGGGEGPGPPRAGANREGPQIPENLDWLWSSVEKQVPHWRSATFRVPQRPGPIVFAISDGESWDLTARSQLALDPVTGRIVAQETYSDQSLGRRVRTWMRFLHTGEALGPIGQTLAGLASAGGALLVWTGISLALRRLFAFSSNWWARSRASNYLEGT